MCVSVHVCECECFVNNDMRFTYEMIRILLAVMITNHYTINTLLVVIHFLHSPYYILYYVEYNREINYHISYGM